MFIIKSLHLNSVHFWTYLYKCGGVEFRTTKDKNMKFINLFVPSIAAEFEKKKYTPFCFLGS